MVQSVKGCNPHSVWVFPHQSTYRRSTFHRPCSGPQMTEATLTEILSRWLLVLPSWQNQLSQDYSFIYYQLARAKQWFLEFKVPNIDQCRQIPTGQIPIYILSILEGKPRDGDSFVSSLPPAPRTALGIQYAECLCSGLRNARSLMLGRPNGNKEATGKGEWSIRIAAHEKAKTRYEELAQFSLEHFLLTEKSVVQFPAPVSGSS